MEKTITIGGIECKFKSSAAIPRLYRLKFKSDIFEDMNDIYRKMTIQKKKNEAYLKECERKGIQPEDEKIKKGLPIGTLDTFENIAYIMHKHGDKSQPDDIGEWLDQFETFDIYKVFPEIFEMWKDENAQLSRPKKKNAELTER